MKKRALLVIVVVLVGLFIRFFCGIYIHDEFGEENLFVKHRPTWRWKFYSPIGMSDTAFEDLTPEKKVEQRYFDEFIRERNLSQ